TFDPMARPSSTIVNLNGASVVWLFRGRAPWSAIPNRWLSVHVMSASARKQTKEEGLPGSPSALRLKGYATEGASSEPGLGGDGPDPPTPTAKGMCADFCRLFLAPPA